jgi:hypothetical protein
MWLDSKLGSHSFQIHTFYYLINMTVSTTIMFSTACIARAARPRRPLRLAVARRFFATDVAPPKPTTNTFQKTKTVAKVTSLLAVSSVVGILVVGVGILAHDAFTYNDRHVDRVPINPLALKPERGGPKNLPIARVLIDDGDDEEAKLLAGKPRLVIVGGGWGVRQLIQFSLVFLN